MSERKGAMFSGSTAPIAKEYGCAVKPVFKNNGIGHSASSDGKLTLGDLAKLNPAWQAQQEIERRKGVVAQDILAQRGKPFVTILQEDAPLSADFWDGHQAQVRVALNGKTLRGYGLGNNPVEAYAGAYFDALRDALPQLRGTSYPNRKDLGSHTELEFTMGNRTWVSRNGGLVEDSQGLGNLVAEGLMAAVHLVNTD